MSFIVANEYAKRYGVCVEVASWLLRDEDLSDITEDNIDEVVKTLRLKTIDKRLADLIKARSVLDKEIAKVYKEKEKLES